MICVVATTSSGVRSVVANGTSLPTSSTVVRVSKVGGTCVVAVVSISLVGVSVVVVVVGVEDVTVVDGADDV